MPHKRSVPAVLLATTLLLAACGSPSADDAATAPEDPDEARVAFEECMADEGIRVSIERIGDQNGPRLKVPDGAGDHQGDSQADPQEPDKIDLEAFEEAEEKCGDLLEAAQGELELDPEQEARLEDAFLAFEECMTEQGIDMGEHREPSWQTASGGHGEGNVIPVPPEDLDLKKWQAAEEHCEHVWDDVQDLRERERVEG